MFFWEEGQRGTSLVNRKSLREDEPIVCGKTLRAGADWSGEMQLGHETANLTKRRNMKYQ